MTLRELELERDFDDDRVLVLAFRTGEEDSMYELTYRPLETRSHPLLSRPRSRSPRLIVPTNRYLAPGPERTLAVLRAETYRVTVRLVLRLELLALELLALERLPEAVAFAFARPLLRVRPAFFEHTGQAPGP